LHPVALGVGLDFMGRDGITMSAVPELSLPNEIHEPEAHQPFPLPPAENPAAMARANSA
jgi:hypothetical protein